MAPTETELDELRNFLAEQLGEPDEKHWPCDGTFKHTMRFLQQEGGISNEELPRVLEEYAESGIGQSCDCEFLLHAPDDDEVLPS